MSFQVFFTPPEDFLPELEAAGSYIACKGRFLLLKRHPTKPYGDTWGLPAGKLEARETAVEAAKRELEEETGLQLLKDQFELVITKYIRTATIDFIFHIFYVSLDHFPKIIPEPEAHTDFLWVFPHEALDLPLIIAGDACIRAVETYLERKNSLIGDFKKK